jgi:RNA polymerase sigma-70 factor (ECF subfamily)
MVRNEALQLLRRKQKWSVAQGLLDLLTWSRVDELEREESIRAVWKALRELPTEQSEVVVLKVWEGFTFQQISQVLGIPAPTAASRYRYGLAKLSSMLKECPEEVSPPGGRL